MKYHAYSLPSEWCNGKRWICSLERMYIYFFSILCCLFIRVSSNSCLPGLSTPGWTYPAGDIFLENGTNLEIFCTIDLNLSYGQNASNLVFYRNSTPVPMNHVSFLNETTSVLRIDSPLPSDDMYYCKLKSGNKQNANSLSSLESSSSSQINESDDTVVCLNSVVIGTKPADAQNLTCVSRNWEELYCNWSAPFNFVNTSYKIYYCVHGRHHNCYSCPNDSDILHNNCAWTLDTKPSYRHVCDYFHIRVIGNNIFGNSTVDMEFHNYGRMVPSAPTSLQVKEKTVSSVLLEWSVGILEHFEKGLSYKVEYMNSFNPWKTVRYNANEVSKKGNIISVNVVDLPYPNVAYDFRVYMKSSVAAGDALWSQPATIIVKTKSCAPFSAPKTDVGSFEISHPSQRDVYVYWQSLLPYEQNGEGFDYNITVLDGDRRVVGVKYSEKTNAYAKVTLLPDSDYYISIEAINNNGSSSPSEIFVPRNADVIEEPSFTKTDFYHGVYQLSWQHSPQWLNVTNFTVFWCDSQRDRPYRCEGRLNWTHYPANTSVCNVTVHSKKIFQFAISVNTLRSSSGMVWASCTVLHNKVEKIKDLWNGAVGSNFIEITWKSECSDRLEGYYVYYCLADDANCRESEQNITVAGGLSIVKGNVTSLKPYERYKIVVAAFTKDGAIGPRSDALFIQTQEGAPDVDDYTVTIDEITNTSVTLKWNKPKITNGPFKGYKISYNQTTLQDIQETKITLSNLHSYSVYDIYVRACTTEHCSVIGKTPLRIRTRIGAPSTIRDLDVNCINNLAARIKWKLPEHLSGPFVTYCIVQQTPVMEIVNNKMDKCNWWTNATEQDVMTPKCEEEGSSFGYTFSVLATTIENDTIFHYGDASQQTYSCPGLVAAREVSSGYKILLYVLLVVCVVVSILIGRSSMYKCQEMKKVRVTLPPNFTRPPLFDGVKDNGCCTKNELDRLNTKLSETDYEDDAVDKDENLDADPYSSGCCTGRSSTMSSVTGSSGTQTSADSGTEMESKILNNVPEGNIEKSNNDDPVVSSACIKWDPKNSYDSSECGDDCYTPILAAPEIINKPTGYVTLQHYPATPNNDDKFTIQNNGYVSVVPKDAISFSGDMMEDVVGKNDFPLGYCRVTLSDDDSSEKNRSKPLLFPGYVSLNPDMTLYDKNV